MNSYEVNGKIIKVDWSKYTKNQKFIKVYYNDLKNVATKSLYYDNNGYYFVWDNKKVYTDNYIAKTIDEINECIVRGNYFLSSDLVACIRKYKNEIKFKMNLYLNDSAQGIPFIPIKWNPIICIPYEIDKCNEDDWDTKILIVPENKDDRSKYLSRMMYISELYDGLIRREIIMCK